jgi:hypothetical protein
MSFSLSLFIPARWSSAGLEIPVDEIHENVAGLAAAKP